MIKLLFAALFITFSATISLYSQSTQDVSVELTAEVQSSPPRIILNWRPNASATGHFVYRKLKTASSWGAVIGNLPGSATQFIDTTVNVGISYEYRVTRQADAFTGFGYINSGIEIAPVEKRGAIILIIDSTFIDSLAFEIRRLTDDLQGDGWHVYRRDVSRTAAVTDVKQIIFSVYELNPDEVQAVFLLGHVPVPYSGEINVDGHTDHTGAYPTDLYYVDLNGEWTDMVINNITAGDPRNHNIPEDGKFDQGLIPSDIEFQIGRVDFNNMPAFSKTETELLRQYLDKDHAYRHGEFSVEHRALIDDNFGYFNGEAFASGGWRNGGPLVGFENVVAGDYLTDMSAGSYLWSYGAGGGWYEGAGGVASTTDLANANLQTVFTMLFGSYFGDWDTRNNFLRAALAQGTTLTNVWSGRPHWQFHHMGLGETIGYSAKVSQNNSTLYNANFGSRFVHMALMGDPTLRNDVVKPISNLTITQEGYHANLTWTASEEDVLGYHVYRTYVFGTGFTRVNDEIITDTFYTDSCLSIPGNWIYMVRAIKLETTPSGTYYNMSQGLKDTLQHTSSPTIIAHFTYDIEENVVTFTNNTGNSATTYLWEFGDGTTSTEINPVHVFEPGVYNVKLTAWNECAVDSIYISLTVEPTATENPLLENIISINPNPTNGVFILSSPSEVEANVKVYSAAGKIILERKINTNESLSIDNPVRGIYFISIEQDNKLTWKKLVIE